MISCRLVFIGAFVMLVFGAILNNASTLAKSDTLDDETIGCSIAKSGLFIAAGVLCVISVALGLVAYIALISNEKKTIPRSGVPNVANEDGVATAQPQMPTKVV